jgi:protein-S-isoprenylcysteine O-methyltransferase Ste14
VVVAQALTRTGFDLTRDAASLLDDGRWGWIQAANFILTGLLLMVAATGLRHTLRTGPGHKWIPRLLTIAGVGLAGGGVFHPDPSGGFPPGTPIDASAVATWHGMAHMVSGSAAFLALIAACFVLGRRLVTSGQRRAAACSRIAGALCAVGVVTAGAPHGSLTLFTGVSLALLWVAIATTRLIQQATS